MRTFCIILPETPEPTRLAREHFKSIGMDGVEFFDGIHAEKFGLQTVFPYERDHPGSGYNVGPKYVGMWLSHLMLWRALNVMAEDKFLILESDAVFGINWRQRMENALADTPPDFDMLYIGSCCCTGKPQQHIKGEVFQVQGPFCTHAYVVAKKALPVLIATQRRCYAPIDIALVLHSHPVMKVYTVLPRIAEQLDTMIAP